jgi:hypothetical protein
MLISQSAAAKRVSVSRQAAQRWKQEDPLPGFFVEVNGVLKIDDEHPEWIAREKKMSADRLERKENNKNRSEAAKLAKRIKKKAKEVREVVSAAKGEQSEEPTQAVADAVAVKKVKTTTPPPAPPREPTQDDLLYIESELATMRKKIATAKMAEEKAKQEEMKTGEMQAGLAPIALLKHFFSFSETMIQRIGRRPYEISPDIAALYRGGNDKKAVDKIVRELESIIKTCVKELIEDVRKEGFKVEGEIKGGAVEQKE